MTQILLIGLGAGAASALLFASVTSGMGLSVILFYLTPLPIMIVALGWSHWAGLLASLTAATALGGVFGTLFFAPFLTSIGAPAWWLGYLALLGRSSGNDPARMDWYPPGRLVLWAAVIGAAVIAAALATLGSDEAAIRGGLRRVLEAMLASDGQNPGVPMPSPEPSAQGPGAGDAGPMIEILVRLLPPAAAVIAALTQTANLWLAGHVVKLSGRLRRPWPDLATLSFPPSAAVLYGVLLACALLPGLAGLAAGLFAATLTIAFAMVGFAVIHTATRGLDARPWILWSAYLSVLFMLWPVLAMTVIGVAETLFGLRGRLSRPGPAQDTGAKDE